MFMTPEGPVMVQSQMVKCKEGRLGGRGYSPQGNAKRVLCKVHNGRQSQEEEEKAFEDVDE